MKKLLMSLLALVLVAGCSSNAPAKEETPAADATEETAEVVTIGAIQYVQHVALDSATEGFKDALAEGGYVEGENLVFDYQNAGADASNCETIANKFVNDGVDLIFANATPAAQAVLAKTTDTPILITSVTDPETSGLVEANAAPGGNLTGTSDLTPVTEQIDLLTKIFPDAKTVGIMYCGSEDNSIFQADMAKAAVEAAGLEWTEVTVSDSNAIQSSVEAIVGKCDVIYIPTDNLLAEGMSLVSQVATAAGKAIICGEEGMCINGGLATYGINYYNLGKLTGEMAIKILNGADPATMAIGYLAAEDCELTINKTIADELGIEIPEDLLAEANIIE